MLIDSTLREGEQSYGTYFDVETKLEIISHLVNTGVEEIELGCLGQEDIAALHAATRSFYPQTFFSVWCRCSIVDLKQAAALGIKRVNMGLPVSEAHISKRLKFTHESLLEHLENVMHEARALEFDYVSLGLEDASRANFAFALRVAKRAQNLGVDRIRISDSVGVLNPLRTAELVRNFRNFLDCDLAVHCHNDFGMATANVHAALESGANYADVSVLGLGERAGIAPLEEVMAYVDLETRTTRYDLSGLRELCHLVAQKAELNIARTKAIAGHDIFACETGLHVHGLNKDPHLFEPFAPEHIHAKRTIGIGKKSGRSAVFKALKDLELPFSKEKLPELVFAVRQLSAELGRPLQDHELSGLACRVSKPDAPQNILKKSA